MKRLKQTTLLAALLAFISGANSTGGIPFYIDPFTIQAILYLSEQGYENFKIVEIDDKDKCLVRYQISDEEIRTLDVREISKEKPFCQEYMELDAASK